MDCELPFFYVISLFYGTGEEQYSFGVLDIRMLLCVVVVLVDVLCVGKEGSCQVYLFSGAHPQFSKRYKFVKRFDMRWDEIVPSVLTCFLFENWPQTTDSNYGVSTMI